MQEDVYRFEADYMKRVAYIQFLTLAALNMYTKLSTENSLKLNTLTFYCNVDVGSLSCLSCPQECLQCPSSVLLCPARLSPSSPLLLTARAELELSLNTASIHNGHCTVVFTGGQAVKIDFQVERLL